MTKKFNIFDLYSKPSDLSDSSNLKDEESFSEETKKNKPLDSIKKRLNRISNYEAHFGKIRAAAQNSNNSESIEFTNHMPSEQLGTEGSELNPKELEASLSSIRVGLSKAELTKLQSSILTPRKKRAKYGLSESQIEEWRKVMEARKDNKAS